MKDASVCVCMCVCVCVCVFVSLFVSASVFVSESDACECARMPVCEVWCSYVLVHACVCDEIMGASTSRREHASARLSAVEWALAKETRAFITARSLPTNKHE